ncbi:MAG: VWA domain-containing protein, partial [Candidatus Bathyarchaeota archaeon]|nr:VWA domain-containing protein [Candidatus Bathyarchaeota archaeon]
MQERTLFPFSAIVNLDKLRLAILINAINPKIGGVLIRGPKGSGKTTVVRALADILPRITVSTLCHFNCNPNDSTNMCALCSERHRKGEKLPSEEREMAIVNLPLGATEDRVVGSLNVEKAIKLGVQALEPGILAEANQNILYVDEVNLLPDHIADDLLDAAATGWNVVEREGISVSHPSRFIFVGTMNPEEGELRPQLLDRFPLSVTVGRIATVEDRIAVVKRNTEFEADPEKFKENYQPLQEELKKRIFQAREILPKVDMPAELLEVICKACLDLKVDGMRPDIVVSKAAITFASFENRTKVTLDDVMVAAELTLSHRTREGGFLEAATPEEIKQALTMRAKEIKHLEDDGPSQPPPKGKAKGRVMVWQQGEASEKEENRLRKRESVRSTLSRAFFAFSRMLGGAVFAKGKRLKKGLKDAPIVDGTLKGGKLKSSETTEVQEKDLKKDAKASPTTSSEPRTPKSAKDFSMLLTRAPIPTVSSVVGIAQLNEGVSVFARLKERFVGAFRLSQKPKIKKLRSHVGKRAETVTTLRRGRPYGWRLPEGTPKDIHMPATIRAAARKQGERERPLNTALQISLEDVREKLRLYRAPMTIMFVIDLSGSMLMNLEALKTAILNSHKEAYRSRDRIGIVACKDTGAVVVQHPITNLRVVANKLGGLKVSGFTPLAAGMLKAWEVLKEAKRRDKAAIPVIIIMTDGSANVPLSRSMTTGEIRQFDTVGIAVRKYEDWAIDDVLAVSKMIKKEGINTIVVNTNPKLYGRETYGFIVTRS